MIQPDILRSQIDLIREVFLYAHRFRGATFVVKLDSSLHDSGSLPGLVADLSLLRHHGIRIVMVPGARRRIDEVLLRYGMNVEHVAGLRITPEESIPLIKMAAFDVANRIMTHLSARGISAVIGNWVRARGVGVSGGVDYQHTGTVERVQRDILEKVMDDGMIPIVPCIGWSATGLPYNVSSDELAVQIAGSLGAEKLFFVTDGSSETSIQLHLPDDVLLEDDGRMSRLTVTQAENVVALNTAHEDRPEIIRLKHTIDALRAGVKRVHIVDGTIDGFVLKEIFSNLGIGTMVHANEYESVRPMKTGDITDVLRLMQPYVARGLLLPRDEDEVRANLADYAVSEVDGTIRACCALQALSGNRGEISALAVDERFKHLGIGEKLVYYQLERARGRRMTAVFALTTGAIDWFLQIGFVIGTIADLPDERRARYDHSRKPKVLVYSTRA
ncbi:MAG: amino-acid N-acetyltransferase [Spirochaetaceae bacterium]